MSWENLLQMTGNCILYVDDDDVVMMMRMMQWRNLFSLTRKKFHLLLHVLALNTTSTTYTFLVFMFIQTHTHTHAGLLIQGKKMNELYQHLQVKRAHLRRRRRKKSLQHVIVQARERARSYFIQKHAIHHRKWLWKRSESLKLFNGLWCMHKEWVGGLKL